MAKKEINMNLCPANRLCELRMEDPAQNQEVVAAEIGIANITYGRYERREREIPGSTLIKISKYYGVSMDYIMYQSDIRKEQKHEASSYHISSERLKVAEDKK